MKTKLIGGAIMIVIAAASIYLFTINNDGSVKNDDSTSNETTSMATSKQTLVASSPSPLMAGSYRNYTDADYAEAQGTRVLFFHASWCPQCRALDKDITAEQASLPDGVTIFKVDYDTATELRKKYDVTLQTTLVRVDQDGTEVRSYVAYDRPTYQNMVYELGL